MQHVVVVDYDPAWQEQYRREAEAIRKILGLELTAIHHIGSTAVPGLAAKPIIDILPVVRSVEGIERYNPEFEALGYECMGEFGIPGRRYYRKGGVERTHQIHLFGEESKWEIERHLAVRDYLRCHPVDAAAYGALKRMLAARFPYDIDGYCDGKEEFVRRLEQEALAWRRGI